MRHFPMLILLLGCLIVAEGSARGEICDPSLDPTPDPEGYRQRAGSLCEGTYVSKVSGPALELVSLTWGAVPDTVPSTGFVLTVPTARKRAGPVHVRALGIPPGLYYRMDAEVTSDDSISWLKSTVLARLGVAPSEIGVFGFARDASGELVYLPVAVASPLAASKVLVVQLRPLTSMDEAKWRYVAAGDQPAKWSTATLGNDRLTIVLLDEGAQRPGTLEVSWTDPQTGRSRLKNFELRP